MRTLLLTLLVVAGCSAVALSQRFSLPIVQPIVSIMSENTTCPLENTTTSEVDTLVENITDLLRRRIAPVLTGREPICSGKSRDNPAASCQEIYECSLGAFPSGNYWITNGRGASEAVTCAMTTLCGTDGGWMEVVNLDMTDTRQNCPSGWRRFTTPLRACGRIDTGGEGQETVAYSTHGTNFTRICGRIIAYQYGRPDGFSPYTSSRTIDDVYVDGISVTYGNPRQHVWTFAALKGDSDTGSTVCPCSDPDDTDSIDIPPWVGNHYFCESGTTSGVRDVFYPLDPLFDGLDCPAPSTCCDFNKPPWFSRRLNESSIGDIEVRVMGNYDDEDNPIEIMEMWVQ